MAIWVSSDWHCDPTELKDSVRAWIRRGKEGNHRLIGDGDLFDILPWGKQKWRQSAAVKEFADLLDGYSFDYVTGNHDPYKTMKSLMAAYSNIRVRRHLTLKENERRYFFSHGHIWALDWGFLGLNKIAPWLVETMVDTAPGFWYWFCRRVGWLASSPPKGISEGKEKERITRLIRAIWAGASDYALKHDCCVILGHTHTTGRHEHGVSKQIGFPAYMVDDGNLPDGTYIEIKKDARLKFL